MKYPYDVKRTQVEGRSFWIARSNTLKGCVGQGDSIEEAVLELQLNEDAWIETAKDINIPIPNIPIEPISEFSGKLTLRISPHEHELATYLAKKEGVSLNQYISDAVIARNHEMVSMDYISDKVVTFSENLRKFFFTETMSKSPVKLINIRTETDRFSYASN